MKTNLHSTLSTILSSRKTFRTYIDDLVEEDEIDRFDATGAFEDEKVFRPPSFSKKDDEIEEDDWQNETRESEVEEQSQDVVAQTVISDRQPVQPSPGKNAHRDARRSLENQHLV